MTKQQTVSIEAVRAQGRQSPLERHLAHQIEDAGLPEPVREMRFHPVRRWRFDFCWPEWMLAVECEGGVYNRGRHVRPSGFVKDAEKYNTAAVQGYRVLRFTASQIESGEALRAIRAMMGREEVSE